MICKGSRIVRASNHYNVKVDSGGMKRKSVLTLMVCTSIFPELFTGNTPVLAFLNPGTLVFLLLGYGLYVLVVREFAVRLRLGVSGLALLGVAYGVVNEAFIAKTLITREPHPLHQFSGYLVLLGFNCAWAAVILLWHAFASVVFPVMLTYLCFPQVQNVPWVKSRHLMILSAVLAVFAIFVFLRAPYNGTTGTLAQLAVGLIAIAACVVLAIWFPGKQPSLDTTCGKAAVLLGLSVLGPTIVFFALAGAKVNAALFFTLYIVVIVLYNRLMIQRGWEQLPAILYFGIGWYAQNAFISCTVSLGNPLNALLMAVVDFSLLMVTWLTVSRRSACSSEIEDWPP